MGPAVRLEFALVQFAFDVLEKYGFVPVVPPVLVREEMMIDAGFFLRIDTKFMKLLATTCFLSAPLRSPLRACIEVNGLTVKLYLSDTQASHRASARSWNLWKRHERNLPSPSIRQG